MTWETRNGKFQRGWMTSLVAQEMSVLKAFFNEAKSGVGC